MTAKTVIASEIRKIVVRQRARSRNKMALIAVPEWAMPTQKTKVVM